MLQIQSIYSFPRKEACSRVKRTGCRQFLAAVLIVDTLLVAHLEYLASEYTV